MKKIVLTGGGSAGHVMPNLALVPELRRLGWEISYIGSHTGIEKDLLGQTDIPYQGIATGKFRRYFSLQNFTDPLEQDTELKQVCFHEDPSLPLEESDWSMESR